MSEQVKTWADLHGFSSGSQFTRSANFAHNFDYVSCLLIPRATHYGQTNSNGNSVTTVSGKDCASDMFVETKNKTHFPSIQFLNYISIVHRTHHAYEQLQKQRRRQRHLHLKIPFNWVLHFDNVVN